MKNLLVILICFFFIQNLAAMQGKISSKSGYSAKGDIRENSDGSVWVTDKNGCSVKYDKTEIENIIIYSDRDVPTEKFLKAYRKTPKASSSVLSNKKTKYDKIINKAAKANAVDPALVKAVIKAESDFNPSNTSCKGACGLMQLMPETAKLLRVKNIYNPEENIYAGTKYLKNMLSLFYGDSERALAAYNAGPGKVIKYGNIPPYRETRDYIYAVKYYYRHYKGPSKVFSYTDESGNLTIYNAD